MDNTNDTSLAAGFSLSRISMAFSLLLPDAVTQSIVRKREAEAKASLAALAVETPPAFAPPPNSIAFACIRLGTKHDLADAVAFATQTLAKGPSALDNATSELSKDLFVAVALDIAYSKKNATIKDMLEFIGDPRWEDSRQILAHLWNGLSNGFRQKEAARWLNSFVQNTKCLSAGGADNLIKQSLLQWEAASNPRKATKKKVQLRPSIQVFKQELIAKALTKMSSIKEEKKAGGDRVLANAQFNNGFRFVPDTRKAGIRLEAAKSRFENLVEPIDQLQVDLVLAGAMAPEDFHVTPILLLGDPGIGKTYLAMQLAEALGVATEKISAGGAQGGFQLTGAHSGWNDARPGSLITLLAEGMSASPVVVIDEVDKIVDARYPVLPVLLDLLESDTARSFKDEFFEIQFDASRIIFVLTANSLEGVPAPLLSRVEVFNVPRPEPEQRLRIIQSVAKQLRLKTKRQIRIDPSTGEMLADRTDIDLRKTTRLVKEAFTRAMLSGETVAKLLIPKLEGRRTIGFGQLDR